MQATKPPKDRSKLSVAGLSIAVAVMLVYIAYNAMSTSGAAATKAYFTTDDGLTQFVETMDHFPPFDHNGKPAYRVWMFSTDGGKTKFVGYLERYTPDAKARMTSALQDFKAGKTHMPPSVAPADTEVKKPGAGNEWVSRANFTEAQKIIRPDIPSGAELEIEMP